MLKNKKAKGNRSIKKCLLKLIEDGWNPVNVEKTGRFLKIKDLYGLWDVMALKRDFNRIKLIQVKTNKKPIKSEMKKFYEFQKIYPVCECEIWVYKDRKEVEVTKLGGEKN